MPLRPRAHVLESVSRTRLHETFTRAVWTVEDLSNDYGEDLFVRIFDGPLPTPYSVFIQAKATDRISKYLSADRSAVHYPVTTDHVTHWERFWEPVLLTVWDSAADITYWETIQTALGSLTRPIRKGQKTVLVPIPTLNVLNDEGLRRSAARTCERFDRFEREKAGAQQLVEALRDNFGIEISYDPQAGILIVPHGTFVHKKDAGERMHLFGRAAARMQVLMRRTGRSPEELLEQSVRVAKQVYEGFEKGASLAIFDESGAILQEWKTFEELHAHLSRVEELEDPDETA